MKISTKGRYGLRILIDLATHDPSRPRLLRDIAQSQQISEKYISRLVLDLRKAKLIRSTRGVNGGFYLVKQPEEITECCTVPKTSQPSATKESEISAPLAIKAEGMA